MGDALCYYCLERKKVFLNEHGQLTCHDCFGSKYRNKRIRKNIQTEKKPTIHDLKRKWERTSFFKEA